MLEKWLDHYHQERFGGKLKMFSNGFVTYRVQGVQFYIEDFYIDTDHRQSHKAFSAMLHELIDLALFENCTQLACHVSLNAKNANEVLISRLKFGFKIVEQSDKKLGLLKALVD